MPVATVKWANRTLLVWNLSDGDVAHPDGYAEVSWADEEKWPAHFTLPIELIGTPQA